YMLFLDNIWLIPLLPALGATIMFFFGRRMQKSADNAVCVGAVVLAFLLSYGAVLQYTGWSDAHNHQPFEKILYTWLGTDTGYLNLFMFSMLMLLLANNYVLMFVGWEGVGLCSYLLIGFYFQRKSASDAANKAFIVNRIGDAGLLLGMFFIAWHMGSLRYVDVT